MALNIREASAEDLEPLLELYLFLHEDSVPGDSQQLQQLWRSILCDKDYHIFIGELDGKIVSSVTVCVIKNLTRGPRPYALIENVVTSPDARGQGYATALLHAAVECARAAGCYKVMLMTGSKRESTLNFYRRAGFDSSEKTAFIIRL